MFLADFTSRLAIHLQRSEEFQISRSVGSTDVSKWKAKNRSGVMWLVALHSGKAEIPYLTNAERFSKF
jgi:hypothetical protein